MSPTLGTPSCRAFCSAIMASNSSADMSEICNQTSRFSGKLIPSLEKPLKCSYLGSIAASVSRRL
jgi:hypothetical protein